MGSRLPCTESASLFQSSLAMFVLYLWQGFGGKFGVESDRQDKSAHGFNEDDGQRVGTNYQPTKPDKGEAYPVFDITL